jgi:polyisoprenyl-phosphate glycosyltransferase
VEYSVVVPVYGNEATLPELLTRLADVGRRLPAPLEAVFVIDGSPDNSYALLKTRLSQMPFASQLVLLSRNFGSFAAIRAGMAVATGDRVAFLAADLQQPVESIQSFFEALDRGADIVIGHRSSRADPLFSRLSSRVFWGIYRRMVQRDLPPNGVDAFGCTKQVRDVLISLPEANSTLVGLLFWVGFRREFVEYARAKRSTGSSGWTWRRKMRYALDALFAFSDLPIRLMIAAGAFGIIAAVAVGAAVLWAWLSGSVEVRGYTPLMLAVLLSFSTTLLALGLVGGYVWRIFENTKDRPAHIMKSVERFEAAVERPAGSIA